MDEGRSEEVADFLGRPVGLLAILDQLIPLEKSDAFRRPERFALLLAACAADFYGRLGWEDKPYPQADLLARALAAAQAVPAGEIARNCTDPAQIPERIRAARVAAVAAVKAAG